MGKLNRQQLNNKPTRKKKPINYKRWTIIIIFIVYAIMSIFQATRQSKLVGGDITLAQFYDMIDNGEIETVNINKSDSTITIYNKSGDIYTTVNPDSDTFVKDIMEKGVDITVQKQSSLDAILSIMSTLPLTVVFAMMAVYLSNTIIGASTKMFTLIKTEDNNTTFDDVRGMGKTKEQVRFIISQLKNWKKLGEVGARPCKGMLLYGPPGVGKTLLAKAIAHEAGVGFISCSGSDFDEVFVGVGAGRVRSLFELAAANAPCIIFIDEIDCVGGRRRGGDGASQDHNQTLNSLLQKMDGLNSIQGIVIIGATNRREVLDSALTRPGRFDRHFYVGAPSTKEDRDELVDIYLTNKKTEADVTLEKVSKLMVGLTGAEVEEALNSAVYLSLADNREGVINYADIDEAIMQLHTDGVSQKHSSKIDEEISSVHEAGHTLISLLLGLPISKVSNIPYTSGMGGVTLRDMDKLGNQKFKLKSDCINDIKVFLAGKCAEELIYGEHSQGCTNDIENVTNIIMDMIVNQANNNNKIINESTLVQKGIIKEISQSNIDLANEMLEKYNSTVYTMLKDNKDKLLALSNLLIEKKTIVQPSLDMLYTNNITKQYMK